MSQAKTILSALLLLAGLLPAPAQTNVQNECYSRFLREGDEALRRREFDRARRKYMAAIECPELNPQQRATASFRLEDADRKRRQELVVAKDKAEVNEKVARQKSDTLAVLLRRADSLRVFAQNTARRAMGNELAFKALITLRDGDRTGALRLAEFVSKYADPGNAKAAEAMLAAAYCNNDPRAAEKLPWRIQTLVENTDELPLKFTFSADGARLGMVSDRFSATIWEVSTGRILFDWNNTDVGTFDATFSPDLRSLAVMGSFGAFKVLDAASGKTRFQRNDPNAEGGLESMTFSRDGTRFGVTDTRRAIWVYDVFSGKEIFHLKSDTVRYGIHFSSDLKKIAVAERGHSPEIHDCENGQKTSLQTDESYCLVFAFSPDNQRLVAATEHKELQVFDTGSGRLLSAFGSETQRQRLARLAAMWQAAYGADSADVNLSVRSRLAERAASELTENVAAPYKLRFSADGSRLAAFSLGNVARIFDLAQDSLFLLTTVKPSPDLLLYDSDLSSGADLLHFTASDRLEIYDANLPGTAANEQKKQHRVNRRQSLPRYGEEPEDGAKEETSSEIVPAARLALNYSYQSQYVPPQVFSTDGRRFAYDAGKGKVHVYDFYTDKTLKINYLKGNESRVLAFDGKGETLVIGREDGSVEVWDAKGRAMSLDAGGSEWPGVAEVIYSPDSQRVALRDRFQKLILLDLESGKVVFQKDKIERPIVFSPKGEIVGAVRNGQIGETPDTVLLFESESGRELARFNAPGLLYYQLLADGRYLHVAGSGTNQLFDLNTGRPPAFFPKDSVYHLRFSADGRFLACKKSGGVEVLESSSGRQVFVFKNQSQTSKSYKPQQQNQNKSNLGSNAEPDGVEHFPYAIAFSDNGDKLLLRTDFDHAAIYETKNWQQIGIINSNENYALRFTPDGRYIWSLSYYYSSIWDASNGALVSSLPSGSDLPIVSPNSRFMAQATENQIVIFDFNLLSDKLTLRGHQGRIRGMAFSPDGATLASASDDGTVKGWNLATGRELFSLVGDTTAAGSVQFSPDGRFLTAWYNGNEPQYYTWVVAPLTLMERIAREGTVAALTAEQIYQSNLEQVFAAGRDFESAFARMLPTEQLAFARYFSTQANIASAPEVYTGLYRRAESLYRQAISGLDSEAALLELGNMLTEQALKLRRDSLIAESRQRAEAGARVFAASQSDDAQTLSNEGICAALSGMLVGATLKFRAALERDPNQEAEIQERLAPLLNIGPDTLLWRDFVKNTLPALQPKLEPLANGIAFSASPQELFDGGEYALAIRGGEEALLTELNGMHRNPLPTQASALASAFGNLSWYYLFSKKTIPLARRSAEAGVALDSAQVYIHINIGHSWLLEGDFAKAMQVYNRWKDEWWADRSMFFSEAILQDFETLARAGKPVWTKDVPRAAELLLGSNWNDEVAVRFLPSKTDPEIPANVDPAAGEKSKKSKGKKKN